MQEFNPEKLKRDIDVIDSNIREIDSQYTNIFEPHIVLRVQTLRFQTEYLIGRWRSRYISDSVLSFKFHNLIHRYTMFRHKWDRHFRIKTKQERYVL